MEVDRPDGRTPSQLRPLHCSRSVIQRAHGSSCWSQGDTKVIAAVYGPKAGTGKNENPEKACIEVVWKPKTGQIGRAEKESEMVLKRTLKSICLLTVNPNTTTSVIIQVVHDDGALLPCAVNAACMALTDAGIPLKHLAVAICCCAGEDGRVLLDPTKMEEQESASRACLVFPNSRRRSVVSETVENVLITSVTSGVMTEELYLGMVERGGAACSRLSDFLRKSLHPVEVSPNK